MSYIPVAKAACINHIPHVLRRAAREDIARAYAVSQCVGTSKSISPLPISVESQITSSQQSSGSYFYEEGFSSNPREIRDSPFSVLISPAFNNSVSSLFSWAANKFAAACDWLQSLASSFLPSSRMVIFLGSATLVVVVAVGAVYFYTKRPEVPTVLNARPHDIPEVFLAQPQPVDESSLSSELLCVVCRDGIRSHALIPCGHMVSCHSCITRLLTLGNCPLCRGHVSNALKIYM